jgi:hypothetical protein
MKRIVLFIGFILLVLLQCCNRHQDTAELLQRYIQAANRHDISAIRTKFANDIVWILGSDTLIGKDAVIAPHEFDAGAGTRLLVKSFTVKGDTVESVLEETNDYMDTLGMPSVIHYPRFVFRDDLLVRIENIRPGLIPPEVDSIDQLWNYWIQSTHPEEWEQIVEPNGSINFSRKNGALLLRLACEWRQSMER